MVASEGANARFHRHHPCYVVTTRRDSPGLSLNALSHVSFERAIPWQMLNSCTTTHRCAVAGSNLLGRIQNRESGAMAEAVDAHGHGLLRIIQRIVRDPWAAEDLMQDVFLRLFTHSRTVHSAASLGSWLRRVARNLALTYVRDHRVTFFAKNAVPHEPPPPDHSLQQEELLGEVHRAAARLDEPFRTTFRVCALEGADYARAAEILGCNKTTVNTRMFRSWRRLREMVAREVDRTPSRQSA
jgi:RNA polymerase sigma-70 factor (ECF subfamily)